MQRIKPAHSGAAGFFSLVDWTVRKRISSSALAPVRLRSAADLGQIIGRFGPRHFQAFERTGDCIGHDLVTIPVAVGGDEEPTRGGVTRGVENVFVGVDVVVPVLAGREIGVGEFSVLLRVREAFFETFGLFVTTEVQIEIQDD